MGKNTEGASLIQTDATALVPTGSAAAIEEAPVPEAVDDPIDLVFRAWAEKYIFNSPMSIHTASYNHLLEQLPKLKALLKEIL